MRSFRCSAGVHAAVAMPDRKVKGTRPEDRGRLLVAAAVGLKVMWST